MDFPITLNQFVTVFGIALFGALLTQFLKPYVQKVVANGENQGLVVNGIAFILCIAIAIVAKLVLLQWHFIGQEVFEAALIGFFGFCLATTGYEGIKNILAFQGHS